MIDLRKPDSFKELDSKNVLGSTKLFFDQGLQLIDDTQDFRLPENYSGIENIVFAGMGGSALGADVIYHLYKKELKIPLYINNDYTLPQFANDKTLVILSSYSGTTEEILSCAEQAQKLSCKITALTTGGDLAKLMEERNVPYIKFYPINNPSNQPRLGSGYTIIGTLIIFSKTGVLKIDLDEIKEEIYKTKELSEKIVEKAIDSAESLLNFQPVIVTSEFLAGAAHTMRNQLNESSKTFASYFQIPELNHHLMEGLQNPKNTKLKFLFLESSLFANKHTKRIELTKDVVSKNNIPFISFSPSSGSQLGQTFEVLSFGGFLSFYLAILYGIDPSPIPWVDYFKEQLSKSS